MRGGFLSFFFKIIIRFHLIIGPSASSNQSISGSPEKTFIGKLHDSFHLHSTASMSVISSNLNISWKCHNDNNNISCILMSTSFSMCMKVVNGHA